MFLSRADVVENIQFFRTMYIVNRFLIFFSETLPVCIYVFMIHCGEIR